ncbi:MAG: alpha/beta fold hydrolase [Armatimonadetes bacterium]|nr:alpha/beta fold hydrolase [Armatimonadota bacterium]
MLVPPFAEEKKAAQRCLVEAAWSLAAAGCEVLRFDFRGTGDSAGGFGEHDVETAVADLHAVLAGRALPVTLIALRFGATPAWLACTADAGIDELVLWEPVVSGAAYLRQNRQRSQIRSELTSGEAGAGAAEEDGGFDFDGFPVSAKMCREMAEADLLTAPLPAVKRVQIVQISGSSRPKKPLQDLHDRLAGAGIEVALQSVAVEPFWSSIGIVDASPVVEATRGWMVAAPNPPAPFPTGEGGGAGPPAGTGPASGTPPSPVGKGAGGLGDPRFYTNHDQRLATVLYRPAEPVAPTGRAIVLLHGWSGYRIGPARLLTEAARALAAEGHLCFSFDFRGRGESEGAVGEASLRSMIDDAAFMVRRALEEPGIERVTLLGVCSGGEVALGASLSDPRIDSLALWSSPIFSGEFTLARQARRGRKALLGYVRKLFLPETWSKLLRGQLNWRLIGRAVSGGRSSEDAAVEDKAPDTATQMTAFEAFAGRLLFVYGGSDPEAGPAWAFYREFLERTGKPYEYHEVAGSNHNFYSVGWKQEVIGTTLNWLRER